ncbi:hypothetical protein GCM10009624_11940 [Gordonia sinesedis]
MDLPIPGLNALPGANLLPRLPRIPHVSRQEVLNRSAEFSLELDLPRQLRRLRRTVAGDSANDELRKAVAGKTVLVTGASSGLGHGAAVELIRAGATVLAVARRADLLRELEDLATREDGHAHALTCDLSDEDDVARLVDTVLTDFEGVDVIINCAGRSIRRELADTTDRMHDFDRVMRLNYFGAVWLTTPLVADMRAKRRGHVINVSTMGTQFRGTPRFAAYMASKAALDQYLGASAPETRPDNVWWTTVHMPLVQTDMIAPAQHAWNGNPILSLQTGVSMILDAVVRKPAKVTIPYGTAIGLLDTLATRPMEMAKLDFLGLAKKPEAPSVIIVGAGMSGIAMALQLREMGIRDYLILEKAGDLGGTWRDNRYPGLTCDVPVYYYSYREHPKSDWDQLFATADDIHQYFTDVAVENGIVDHIKFNAEVVDAEFTGGSWTVSTGAGESFTAQVLVCATGVLHHPHIPDIPGLDEFTGTLCHSARWDPDTEVAGKRVGIIGSGSTGVQLVTDTSRTAEQVVLFQRTPQWVVHVPNPQIPDVVKQALRVVPGLHEVVYRACMAGMDFGAIGTLRPGIQRAVISRIAEGSLGLIEDDRLRERLTPSDELMCKRLIISADFHEQIQAPNVELSSGPIERVTADGVIDSDGTLHELDILILATGFEAQDYMRPMRITGPRGDTLADAWAAGPKAHLTTMIPGLPNLFLLIGPHSPIGNASLVPIAQTQAAFVGRWLERMRDESIVEVEPTRAAADRFDDDLASHMDGTIWTTGCDSWYLGPDGTPVLWPQTLRKFRSLLANPDLDDYIVRTRPSTAPASHGVARSRPAT